MKEMRHQFHNAVMRDGERTILTVIIMLVWCAVGQKVNFNDNDFIPCQRYLLNNSFGKSSKYMI